MRRERGLTVAETLLAMAFLALAILTMVGLFASSFKLLNKSSFLTTGTEVGREFIERVKLLDGDAPPVENLFYDGSVPAPQSSSGFPPPPYPFVDRDGVRYTLSVEIGAAPNTTSAKVLTVWVRWKESGRVELQTYL